MRRPAARNWCKAAGVVALSGSATASAPADPWVALNGFLNFPRPIDAPWITTLFILSAFSFENYYGVPGLARSILKPEHYDLCLRAYLPRTDMLNGRYALQPLQRLNDEQES